MVVLGGVLFLMSEVPPYLDVQADMLVKAYEDVICVDPRSIGAVSGISR